ncbi:MAG: hypothetical protein L0H15_10680, partial [Nitrosospira sp.]|nr:hypothetical protein [Nitrosospira sp.]
PHPEGEHQIIRNIDINHDTDLLDERSTTGFRFNFQRFPMSFPVSPQDKLALTMTTDFREKTWSARESWR